jgi:hypothetical protein
MLEEHCEKCGYEVIFFPKYHPELNCIEQCWGYAKRIYRMFPASSTEEDLEKNMLAALDLVPLELMRRNSRLISSAVIFKFDWAIHQMQTQLTNLVRYLTAREDIFDLEAGSGLAKVLVNFPIPLSEPMSRGQLTTTNPRCIMRSIPSHVVFHRAGVTKRFLLVILANSLIGVDREDSIGHLQILGHFRGFARLLTSSLL